MLRRFGIAERASVVHLKTGLADDVHRAIDFMFEGNQISVGDKSEPVTGVLKFDSSAQYDRQAEHLLHPDVQG